MIRLYGLAHGGSLARVSEGMRMALTELNLLAGFVPVDAYDSETVYSGHDAETAVFVGPPSAAAIMQSIGWHKERWILLLPNSSWMPTRLVSNLEKVATGFIASSKWAATVLRRYTKLPVSVWQLGVVPVFEPDAKAHAENVASYQAGHFDVIHMASTHMQRKGTTELITAWGECIRVGKLGKRPRLHLVVDAPDGYFDRAVKVAATDPDGALDEHVLRSLFWLPRQGFSALNSARFYRSAHLIAQPSRAEGFGLVPLEAAACGVPVLMTACTGHAEYAFEISAQLVDTGDEESIDDGPGAMAPSINMEMLVRNLVASYEHWLEFAEASQKLTGGINTRWSWMTTTKRWLVSEGK